MICSMMNSCVQKFELKTRFISKHMTFFHNMKRSTFQNNSRAFLTIKKFHIIRDLQVLERTPFGLSKNSQIWLYPKTFNSYNILL